MTIPFEVPPFAWTVAIAATMFVAWIYTRRPEHFIKRLGWAMVEAKVEAYRSLLPNHIHFSRRRAATGGRVMAWVLMLTFLGYAGLSLLVCVGVFQNPAPLPRPAHVAPGNVELIIEGQSIYARPTTAPTTQRR